MAEPLRLLQELIISVVGAVAWYAAGQQARGWSLGLVAIVHYTLMHLLGGILLQQESQPLAASR